MKENQGNIMKKLYALALMIGLGATVSLNAASYHVTLHNDTDQVLGYAIGDSFTKDLQLKSSKVSVQLKTIQANGKYEFTLGAVDVKQLVVKIGDWQEQISLASPQKYYSVRYDSKKNRYYIHKAGAKAQLK
jgi:hypothetical protein